MLTLIPLLLTLTPVAAAAGWTPPTLKIAVTLDKTSQAGAEVNGDVLAGFLGVIQMHDIAGLGGSAEETASWSAGRKGLRLMKIGGHFQLRDSNGNVRQLESGLGSRLVHNLEYFGMTPETLAHPVNRAELDRFIISSEGVEMVANLFLQAFDGSLTYQGQTTIPELGGEATLASGRLSLKQAMGRPLGALTALTQVRDIEGLRAFAAAYPAEMKTMDEEGVFAFILEKSQFWDDNPAKEAARKSIVRNAVSDRIFVSNYSWILSRADQFEFISRNSWEGRFVGNWHIHPPMVGKSRFHTTGGPSHPDIVSAAAKGRSLLFVFQSDGFDFYDLVDFDQRPYSVSDPSFVTRFRSQAWETRFAAEFTARYAVPGALAAH
ncbi:MAG: hypothetical protein COB53_13100 [Elusimicrobia bacterium]|nr:MAG: hypothetical protein COB53_13100 [Elusimicrobiota bacterium]